MGLTLNLDFSAVFNGVVLSAGKCNAGQDEPHYRRARRVSPRTRARGVVFGVPGVDFGIFFLRNNCLGSILDRPRIFRFWQLCARSRAHLIFL